MRLPFSAALSLVALCVAIPAAAQNASGMSEAELVDSFNKAKTRGLKLSVESLPEQAIEPSAAASTATATVQGDGGIYLNVRFDFDSAALREDQRPAIDKVCRALEASDVETFRIVGHTDASGSAQYNARLSRLRAEEVQRYMVSNCTIDPQRLEAVGVGESAPLQGIDPTADENRRVEFLVLS